jgi:hypothetical protein
MRVEEVVGEVVEKMEMTFFRWVRLASFTPVRVAVWGPEGPEKGIARSEER